MKDGAVIVHEVTVDKRESGSVKRGEMYAPSYQTGIWYRVTRWVDHGAGKYTAISKKEVDETCVPGRPKP